jgi:predicted metal-dependent HD superfamily phosphohydrolase
MRDLLQRSWARAWAGCLAQGDGAEIAEQLLGAYREPHRAYHSVQHLVECLTNFGEHADLARRPHEVELALWFHDAVYDVRASDNEERSAELATRSLSAATVPVGTIEFIRSLILATKHTEAPNDPDGALLCDIDLAILAASPSRFAEYEFQIRAEYAHVADAAFAKGRSEVLRQFLDRPRIYGTDFFYSRFEQRARQNLQQAIAQIAA